MKVFFCSNFFFLHIIIPNRLKPSWQQLFAPFMLDCAECSSTLCAYMFLFILQTTVYCFVLLYIVPPSVNKLLHLMNRDSAIDDEELQTISTNWKKINNSKFITMYALGKQKKLVLPVALVRLTKRALQTMTNYRLRNIHLPEKVRVFKRLYMRDTVFHSAEVYLLLCISILVLAASFMHTILCMFLVFLASSQCLLIFICFSMVGLQKQIIRMF